ncbi:glycosyltransferase family 2 protein [Megamonas funiformis]|uniref:Glycosyltransferase n=1 Tax=Megamonas funiformis TaxID=437897 RepID=A0AAW4U2Z0_9FIRM|nr:glycosyltransferase family 2 protein [Megamonas funiformis]MCB6828883.1 glycosyltransferase [Megamonas funiformis]
MKDLRISVIMATYNAEKTVEKTIKSIITQTYKNIEFIIIDGGSKDKTIEIIKKYHKYISYWVTEKDNGIYDALNKGIERASGEYIYILGADDFFCDNNIIENVVNNLDDSIDVLSGSVFLMQFNMKKLFNNYSKEIKNNLDEEDLINILLPPHQGLFVKSNIMKKYLFDIKYKLRADFKFELIMLTSNFNIKFVNFPIAFYSVEGISNRKTIEMIEETINILKELKYISVDYNRKHKKEKLIKTCIKNFLINLKLWKYSLYLRGWKKC